MRPTMRAAEIGLLETEHAVVEYGVDRLDVELEFKRASDVQADGLILAEAAGWRSRRRLRAAAATRLGSAIRGRPTTNFGGSRCRTADGAKSVRWIEKVEAGIFTTDIATADPACSEAAQTGRDRAPLGGSLTMAKPWFASVSAMITHGAAHRIARQQASARSCG